MSVDIDKMNPRIIKAEYISQEHIIGFNNDKALSEKRIVVYYEFVYFLNDGGKYNINGKDIDIHKGEIRFLKPGDEIYSYRFGNVYSIHFTLGFDSKSAIKNDELDAIDTCIKPFDDEKVKSIIQVLIDAVESGDIIMQKFGLWNLIYYLSSIQNKTALLKSEKTIEKAKNYIKEHLSEYITLNDLSDYLFLNPIYFQRMFKSHVGISPFDYIQKLRIEKAKQLLCFTDMTVSEIASSCGFCNSSYFIKIFKQNCGVTPAFYRKNN